MVLKALSDQCAKATFFMMGEHIAQESPELAKRVVSEGHSAGIHSYTHPHMTALSAEEQLADLQKTRDIYKATFGIDTPAYRFPFLEETPTLLAALKQANITVARLISASTTGCLTTPPRFSSSGLLKAWTKPAAASSSCTTPTSLPPKPSHALLKTLKDKGYKVVHLEWEK
jgi:peptidoglycan/xylan/chitin deacetylase (PgdA/CDA1 family)